MNYRIVIAYDGTEYQGWQWQHDQPTIQQAISQALQKIEGHPVIIHGAGRTDSGVHAEGQTASFQLTREWSGEKLRDALNGNLPVDIRILKAERVSDEFHARFDACGKTYRYQLDAGVVANPLLLRYSWHYPNPIDEDLLNATAQLLIGTHDFTAFTVASCETKTRVRTLTEFVLKKVEWQGSPLVQLYFSGDGFLRYQVRRMVTTLLAFNRRRLHPTSFDEVVCLSEQVRANTLAPAKGLTLVKVGY